MIDGYAGRRETMKPGQLPRTVLFAFFVACAAGYACRRDTHRLAPGSELLAIQEDLVRQVDFDQGSSRTRVTNQPSGSLIEVASSSGTLLRRCREPTLSDELTHAVSRVLTIRELETAEVQSLKSGPPGQLARLEIRTPMPGGDPVQDGREPVVWLVLSNLHVDRPVIVIDEDRAWEVDLPKNVLARLGEACAAKQGRPK